MTKRKQIGFMSALALTLGSMAIPAHQANAGQANTENVRVQANKEGIPKERKIVKPVSVRNQYGESGFSNPYKFVRTPKKNQRQIRKYKRQNPNL
jgi:hypothetical protein